MIDDCSKSPAPSALGSSAAQQATKPDNSTETTAARRVPKICCVSGGRPYRETKRHETVSDASSGPSSPTSAQSHFSPAGFMSARSSTLMSLESLEFETASHRSTATPESERFSRSTSLESERPSRSSSTSLESEIQSRPRPGCSSRPFRSAHPPSPLEFARPPSPVSCTPPSDSADGSSVPSSGGSPIGNGRLSGLEDLTQSESGTSPCRGPPVLRRQINDRKRNSGVIENGRSYVNFKDSRPPCKSPSFPTTECHNVSAVARHLALLFGISRREVFTHLCGKFASSLSQRRPSRPEASEGDDATAGNRASDVFDGLHPSGPRELSLVAADGTCKACILLHLMYNAPRGIGRPRDRLKPGWPTMKVIDGSAAVKGPVPRIMKCRHPVEPKTAGQRIPSTSRPPPLSQKTIESVRESLHLSVKLLPQTFGYVNSRNFLPTVNCKGPHNVPPCEERKAPGMNCDMPEALILSPVYSTSPPFRSKSDAARQPTPNEVETEEEFAEPTKTSSSIDQPEGQIEEDVMPPEPDIARPSSNEDTTGNERRGDTDRQRGEVQSSRRMRKKLNQFKQETASNLPPPGFFQVIPDPMPFVPSTGERMAASNASMHNGARDLLQPQEAVGCLSPFSSMTRTADTSQCSNEEPGPLFGGPRLPPAAVPNLPSAILDPDGLVRIQTAGPVESSSNVFFVAIPNHQPLWSLRYPPILTPHLTAPPLAQHIPRGVMTSPLPPPGCYHLTHPTGECSTSVPQLAFQQHTHQALQATHYIYPPPPHSPPSQVADSPSAQMRPILPPSNHRNSLVRIVHGSSSSVLPPALPSGRLFHQQTPILRCTPVVVPQLPIYSPHGRPPPDPSMATGVAPVTCLPLKSTDMIFGSPPLHARSSSEARSDSWNLPLDLERAERGARNLGGFGGPSARRPRGPYREPISDFEAWLPSIEPLPPQAMRRRLQAIERQVSDFVAAADAHVVTQDGPRRTTLTALLKTELGRLLNDDPKLSRYRGSKPITIEAFGSCTTDLCLPWSDIDIAVNNLVFPSPANESNGGPQTDSRQGVLLAIGDYLNTKQRGGRRGALRANAELSAWVRNVYFVPARSMPLLTISTDRIFHGHLVQVDISVVDENHKGLPAIQLVKRLTSAFPTARRLMLVLKQILQRRRINKPFEGGLSSYALLLMLIAFLRHPVLYGRNTEGVGEQLVNFLAFYGGVASQSGREIRIGTPRRWIKMAAFDYLIVGIDIGTFIDNELRPSRQDNSTSAEVDSAAESLDSTTAAGSGVSPDSPEELSSGFFLLNNPFDPQIPGFPRLQIRDPLDPTNNVGRAAFNIEGIRGALLSAYHTLSSRCLCCCNSVPPPPNGGGSYHHRQAPAVCNNLLKKVFAG